MDRIDLIRFGLVLLVVCVLPAMLFVWNARGRDRTIAWRIAAAGAAAPWIVGASVKVYLDRLGSPTLPWSYFVNGPMMLFAIPLSIWFSFPFLALAVLHARVTAVGPFLRIRSRSGRFAVTMGTFAGGIVGVCHNFTSVFWVFDPLFLLFPVGAAYLPDMFVGSLVGFFAGRRLDARTQHEAIRSDSTC